MERLQDDPIAQDADPVHFHFHFHDIARREVPDAALNRHHAASRRGAVARRAGVDRLIDEIRTVVARSRDFPAQS